MTFHELHIIHWSKTIWKPDFEKYELQDEEAEKSLTPVVEAEKKCRMDLERAKRKLESENRLATEILDLEDNRSRLEEKLKKSEIDFDLLTTQLEGEQILTAQLQNKIKEFQVRIEALEKAVRPTAAAVIDLEKPEDSKNDSTKHETIKSIYDDIPNIFNNVKEVPPVFTINSFNFTMSDTVVNNCECTIDKNAIRKISKSMFHILWWCFKLAFV